jgi:hypothetical protein
MQRVAWERGNHESRSGGLGAIPMHGEMSSKLTTTR